MRFRQVEAFAAVMQSGGVTAAAALLHISQPSVSRLIADLEASVGFSLFERRGGRVFPTAQAQALYETVRRSFTGLDLLDQAARRIRAHPMGTLRVAALAALSASILPAALRTLRDAYPQIKVTVESVGQYAVEDRVFLAQADLGLGVATTAREGVRTQPLIRAPYVCILPAGHRLAERGVIRLKDLAGEDFVGPMHETDALWFGIDQALAAEGAWPVRRLETQHSFTAYSLVEAGLGIAVVEPFSALRFARLGVVVRRLEADLAVNFAFLEPDIGPAPVVVGLLRESILAETRACLAKVDRLTAAG